MTILTCNMKPLVPEERDETSGMRVVQERRERKGGGKLGSNIIHAPTSSSKLRLLCGSGVALLLRPGAGVSICIITQHTPT